MAHLSSTKLRKVARRAAPAGLVVGLAVVTAACAGPQAPLTVGVKNVATNVQFGSNAQKVVYTPPVGSISPPPPISSVFALPGPAPTTAAPPLATTYPTTTVNLGPCPPASPFAVALVGSVNTIPKPPVAATYSYRDTGTYQTSGASPSKGTYPKVETRTVKNVSTSTPQDTASGGFSFDVATVLGNTTTTTSYGYIPPTSASQTAAGSVPAAGLYVTQVVTQVGSQAPTTFSPSPPGMLLLEVPAASGDEWQSSATDPTTGVTEFWTATEKPDTLVNACGQVIDALTIHLDGNISISENAGGVEPTTIATGQNPGGQQVGPTTMATFTATYDLATQYGGLSVEDMVDTTGTENGAGINRKVTSTIDTLPKQPS